MRPLKIWLVYDSEKRLLGAYKTLTSASKSESWINLGTLRRHHRNKQEFWYKGKYFVKVFVR